jgi:hypothetical protein
MLACFENYIVIITLSSQCHLVVCSLMYRSGIVLNLEEHTWPDDSP